MSTPGAMIEVSRLRYIFRARCFIWLISVLILLVLVLSLASCFKNSRTLSWEELLSKDSLSNSDRVILAIEYSKSDPNSSKGESLLAVLTAKATPDLLELYINELLIKAGTEREFASALGILMTVSSEINRQAGIFETIQPFGGVPNSKDDYADLARRQKIIFAWKQYAKGLMENGNLRQSY